MPKLELDEINRLSFPDFNVLEIQFDPKIKYLYIKIDGAWFETENSKGKELKEGTMRFHSWENIILKKYDINCSKWILIAATEFEPIKDICEFQITKKNIYLRGFGKQSGLWVEYELVSPIMDFEFEE